LGRVSYRTNYPDVVVVQHIWRAVSKANAEAHSSHSRWERITQCNANNRLIVAVSRSDRRSSCCSTC
jgi:hypothetical protein